MRIWLLVITCFITIPAVSQDHTVAREWNEVLLEAIRNDFARPTIHARNLFHSSAVMYDAWAAYDEVSAPYFLGNQVGDYTFPFNGVAIPADPFERQAAQEEAMSYAVYRLLKHRFEFSPGAEESLERFDSLMVALGYDIVYASTDYENEGPAALGNYIADNVILYGLGDGSNEETDYSNQYYLPVNEELVMVEPGNPDIEDPNRWQPLNIPEFIDQGGNPFTVTPPFLSPEWGNVVGFALDDSVKTTYERDGDTYHVFHDPGPPPFIDTLGTRENDEAYRWGFSLVSIWQSHHDPADGVLWDISPASIGNVPSLPTDFADYEDFYNLLDGGDTSLGHEINPHTGEPYEPQLVPRADYARILAEFWADGPDSETPPGHWFDILNYVNDHPDLEKRWKGEGPILDDLEWDIKTYFSLGGAMHDAAIAAWSVKGWYDYIRPVSAIRFMADRGQNSDPDLPSFDPVGIPLVEGLVELVEPGDPLAGLGNVNVGKIKLYTWRGPDYIEDPEVDMAGVGWILAENWWPYQRPTFVTPPFAGYVSGHSTYSRAAAEMMTFMTGDAYFPGGMGEFEAPQNEFLVFEEGPSVDVTLQWATYRDASDQCSLSRIWGGIHPPADDIPGRLMGIEIGNNAFIHANEYFDAGLPSLALATPSTQTINLSSTGESFTLTLEFDQFMNVDVNPSISFEPSNLNEVLLGDPSYNWVDENTVDVTWQIANASLEVFESSIQITGAESTEALPMVEAELENLFIVDQIVPLALSVESTASLINDEAAGESVQFDLFFSEPMSEESAPVVEFTSSVVEEAASITNAQWLNSDQYRLTVEFDDTGIEAEDVLISVSGVEDLANNPSDDAELTAAISIDTRNPLVDLVLFSENPLVVEASETEGFTVLILFDEQMEETDDIQLILTGGPVNDILTPSGNGEWQNPFNYLQTYDILAEAPTETSVSLTVVDAKDASGNTMEFTSLQDAFNIVVDVVNVEENENAVMTLFPNPLPTSSQELYLSGNRNYELWSIYSMDGKLITSGRLMGTNVERIPLVDMAVGQYILCLTGNNRERTIPFFIQAN